MHVIVSGKVRYQCSLLPCNLPAAIHHAPFPHPRSPCISACRQGQKNWWCVCGPARLQCSQLPPVKATLKALKLQTSSLNRHRPAPLLIYKDPENPPIQLHCVSADSFHLPQNCILHQISARLLQIGPVHGPQLQLRHSLSSQRNHLPIYAAVIPNHHHNAYRPRLIHHLHPQLSSATSQLVSVLPVHT